MAEKTDRRVRKTKNQLKLGLAKLMQQKSIKEITVKELVNEVDINRSTFYLHYTDIYDLLHSIEDELTIEIRDSIHAHPVSPFTEDSLPFVEDIFRILAENLISVHSLDVLKTTFPDNIQTLKYSYAFCLTGCVGLIKAWLNSDTGESPQEMARIAFQLIMHTIEAFTSQTPAE